MKTNVAMRFVVPVAIATAATAIAVASARPSVGGWNDGSRMAAVEALVDHGTFAIDVSVFANDSPSRQGTKDKLFIDGHFYSDKPPVVSLLMAYVYRGARWLGMPTAA